MSGRYIARHLYTGMPQGELIAALRETMEALERADATLAASEQRRRFGDALTAGEPWPTDLSNVQSGQLLKIVASGELTTLPPTAPDTIVALRFEGTPLVRNEVGNLDLQSDYVPASARSVLILQSTGERYLEIGRTNGGGALPPGLLGGDILIWDSINLEWVPTSDVNYSVSISTLSMPSAFIGGSSECVGNWLIHGPPGIKLEITESGPGARRFAVDTAEDRIDLLAGQAIKRTAVSSTPYNVAKVDYYLAVNTGVAITINLRAASEVAGKVIVIKDVAGTGAATNNITITPAGSDTVEVGSIAVDRGSITLVSDGVSNWEVI